MSSEGPLQVLGTIELSNNTAMPCGALASGQSNAGGAIFFSFDGLNASIVNTSAYIVGFNNSAPDGSGPVFGAGFPGSYLVASIHESASSHSEPEEAVYFPGQVVLVDVQLISVFGNLMVSVPVLEVVITSPCWSSVSRLASLDLSSFPAAEASLACVRITGPDE